MWQTFQEQQTPHLVGLIFSLTSWKFWMQKLRKKKKEVLIFFQYIFFCVFCVLNVKLKKHRKGIGELRDTKAKYRDPQVCVCFIQADTETDSKPTFIKRSFQHQSLCCWKRFGSPCCCRLLQCSKRNCCQKTLKLVSST